MENLENAMVVGENLHRAPKLQNAELYKLLREKRVCVVIAAYIAYIWYRAKYSYNWTCFRHNGTPDVSAAS